MLIIPYYAFILFGVLVALLFFVLFVRSKQPIQLYCTLLWTAPLGYEAWVISGCSGECNIRVDLLIVFPLELVVLSWLSIFAWHKFKQRTIKVP